MTENDFPIEEEHLTEEQQEVARLIAQIRVAPADFRASVAETVAAARKARNRRKIRFGGAGVMALGLASAGVVVLVPWPSTDHRTGVTQLGAPSATGEEFGSERDPVCFPQADVGSRETLFLGTDADSPITSSRRAVEACGELWRDGALRIVDGVGHRVSTGTDGIDPNSGGGNHPVPPLFACAGTVPAAPAALPQAWVFPALDGQPNSCAALGRPELNR